jgi:cell division protein FtsW (lipid II flippase)
MMREHEDMDSFLDEVCTQVKAREMHPEIRQEIGNHLQELIAQKEAEGGYTPKEAAFWAFRQMGDPAELGKRLHLVHKPQIYWGLLVTVLLFSIMSLFAMLSVDAGNQNTTMSFVYFTHQFMFVFLGIVIMCGLYFWDFRKLKDYSWLLYWITVGGMVLTRFFGVQVYGASRYFSVGPIQLDWIGIRGAGLVLLSAVIWFLTRLVYSFKAVREPYGRTLILALAMLLAIQLVYGLAMASGKMLIIDLPFPFLSYGGSHLMIEYAVVGLLLGVYRRKDMIPYRS